MKATGKKLIAYAFHWMVLLCLFIACVPVFEGIQSDIDMTPPQLVAIDQTSQHAVILEFSEDIIVDQSELSMLGDGNISTNNTSGSSLEVGLTDCDSPGKEYGLQGLVRDAAGNELWFQVPFYGFNPEPAGLLMSEFINENSSSRLEKLELLVTSAGSLGGITIYNGAPNEYKSRMIFTDQWVEEGEYIIIHFRYDESDMAAAGEIDEYGESGQETFSKAFSSQATDSVRDFWVTGYQGLSDTNGAISIASDPEIETEILDAVIYSNRTYESDADHGSFGTSYTWNVVSYLANAGAWAFSENEIRPEDCLRTADSTSTRSLNRWIEQADTNSPSDWYIGATGTSSFGQVNTSDLYQP